MAVFPGSGTGPFPVEEEFERHRRELGPGFGTLLAGGPIAVLISVLVLMTVMATDGGHRIQFDAT